MKEDELQAGGITCERESSHRIAVILAVRGKFLSMIEAWVSLLNKLTIRSHVKPRFSNRCVIFLEVFIHHIDYPNFPEYFCNLWFWLNEVGRGEGGA